MGLEDFATDSGNNQNTQNNTPNIPEEAKTGENKTSQGSNRYCPQCGSEGEETDQYYYRCTLPLDECSIITFIRPRE